MTATNYGYYNYLPEKAHDACKAYTESDFPAGSWRLPTLRELMLIYVLHEQLSINYDDTNDNIVYIAGATKDGKAITKQPKNAAYVVISHSSYPNAIVEYIPNLTRTYIRCVRDL